MSGHTQQQIALIDGNGCPTDPNIFPSLEKLPGTKTLVGRFDGKIIFLIYKINNLLNF